MGQGRQTASRLFLCCVLSWMYWVPAEVFILNAAEKRYYALWIGWTEDWWGRQFHYSTSLRNVYLYRSTETVNRWTKTGAYAHNLFIGVWFEMNKLCSSGSVFLKLGSAKGCQGFRKTKMRNGGRVLLAVRNLCVRIKISVAIFDTNHYVTRDSYTWNLL